MCIRDRCIRSKSEYLKEGIELLDNITAKLNEDMSYLEVMGLEGNAAKVYFPRMFDNVKWSGRKPRIKSDYINVTLDIGYTCLLYTSAPPLNKISSCEGRLWDS